MANLDFSTGAGAWEENIARLRRELDTAQAILIGAGAGLSTSAGFRYDGERFERTFSDFRKQFGITDMYSGGFYLFPSPEILWAWWSRHIWVNRWTGEVGRPYRDLLSLVQGKNYFVLTTNVDHQFQLAGFDKQRLFYTQGDYGLFQCSGPCGRDTWDNLEQVKAMVESQGFVIEEDGSMHLPEGVTPKMAVPTELLPKCPKCGRPLTTNLRVDGRFVEDDGWRAANDRYGDFLEENADKHILLLELGVGGNTPGIIKYPFWRLAARNPQAVYAILNYGEAICPREIEAQSICLDGDIGKVLREVMGS